MKLMALITKGTLFKPKGTLLHRRVKKYKVHCEMPADVGRILLHL